MVIFQHVPQKPIEELFPTAQKKMWASLPDVCASGKRSFDPEILQRHRLWQK